MRAAIYCRVSTDEQVEGTSLYTQLESCRDHASRHGWSISGEYIDEGVSGVLASRPQLDLLMREVRTGKHDIVVVAKLDRAGRSVRHLASLLGELDDLGVQFVSVAEQIDGASAVGRLQRNMLSGFAEFERERIKERMIDGVAAVARDGYWPGGPPPFGYKLIPDGRHTRLTINCDESEVLLQAIKFLVDDRMSTSKAARELNSLGLLPRSASRWTQQALRGQLKASEGISGRWTYRRPSRKGKPGKDPLNHYGPPITISIPAIISPERHEALRAALARTSTGEGATKRKHPYLLSHRLTSPCGQPMHGLTNDYKTSMYKCAQSWSWVPKDTRCHCSTVAAALIEPAIWHEIVKLLSTPAALMAGARQALDLAGESENIGAEDLAGLDRKIERLEHAAGEQIAKLLAAGIDPAVAQNAIASLQSDLKVLRDRRATVAAWAAVNAERTSRAARLYELAAQATTLLADPNPDSQAQIIEALNVRVTITGYTKCPDCHGTGWEKRAVDENGKRPKGWTGIVPCNTCKRSRRAIQWTMTGEVPDSALLQPTEALLAERPGWPFQVGWGTTG